MNLLDRYIAKVLISATFIVFLLFFGVQSFVQFLAELQNIGRGNYGVWQALLYVPIQSIGIMYQLFPVAGLIGCLLGLGRLATHSELIVMQAAGVSRVRINLSVIKATVIMLLIVTAVGEGIGPWASRFADNYKSILITGKHRSGINNGWVRDGDNFMYVGNVITPEKITNVIRYYFSDDKLKLISVAKSADFMDQQWIFHDVTQTQLTNKGADLQHFADQAWGVNFNVKLLGIANLNTSYETLPFMYQLIKFMQANNLQINQVSFSFFQRLFQPLATMVMICLAVPFIFGPLRSSSMGLRMLVGILLGFVFYTFNQFLGPFSMVYQMQPVVAAVLPIVIFLAINVWLFFLTR